MMFDFLNSFRSKMSLIAGLFGTIAFCVPCCINSYYQVPWPTASGPNPLAPWFHTTAQLDLWLAAAFFLGLLAVLIPLGKKICEGYAFDFACGAYVAFAYMTTAWTGAGNNLDETTYALITIGPNRVEDSGHISLLNPLYQLILISIACLVSFVDFKRRGVPPADKGTVLRCIALIVALGVLDLVRAIVV